MEFRQLFEGMELERHLNDHYKYNVDDKDFRDVIMGGSSHAVNDYLWKKHQGGYKAAMNTERYNKELLNTVRATNNVARRILTPKPMTLYSGTRHDPREIMNKEGIVHHPAFMSTSTDPHIGKSFGRRNKDLDRSDIHVLRLRINENHPGIWMHPYAPFSHEKEMLLPSGLDMRHLGTKEKSGLAYGGLWKLKTLIPIKYHLHDMEIV